MTTVVYLLQGHGYDDEFTVAAYSTRELAEAQVTAWDEAVRQSLRDSPAGGVCHVGDWFVTEMELDADVKLTDRHCYLHAYLYGDRRPS